jgi:hypothetical protein
MEYNAESLLSDMPGSNFPKIQRDEYYRGFIARTRGSAASAHATTEDTSPLHQPRSTTPELQEREETVNLRYLF